MRKQAISVFLGFVLLSPSILAAPQTETSPLKITDLFTERERRDAGLSKLDPSELAALNAALTRILLQLDSGLSTPDSQTLPQSDEQVALYDSSGRAVAYIDSDEDHTIYLWSGKPVAYLDEDSLYGFNGKHLGWFRKGTVYDHDGNGVAAIAENFRGPVGLPPLKGLKGLRPLKSLKELKPLKPLFSLVWSDLPARVFFLRGAGY